jgi:hypothetical protein
MSQVKAHASPLTQALKTQAQPRKFHARAASLAKTQPPDAKIARKGGLPTRHTRQNAQRAASENPPRRPEARAVNAVPQGKQAPLAKHASRVKCERAAKMPMRRSVASALPVSTKTNQNKRPVCRACQESTRRTPTAASVRSATSTHFQTKLSSSNVFSALPDRAPRAKRARPRARIARPGGSARAAINALRGSIVARSTPRRHVCRAPQESISSATEQLCACRAYQESTKVTKMRRPATRAQKVFLQIQRTRWRATNVR